MCSGSTVRRQPSPRDPLVGVVARVRFGLYSDIWCPWVLGFLEEDWPAPTPREMFDNRELAGAHTPRLNRFLAAARQACLGAQGEWLLEEPKPGAESYRFMVDEVGILLDAR